MWWIQPVDPFGPTGSGSRTDKLNGISDSFFGVLRANEEHVVRNVILIALVCVAVWFIFRWMLRRRDAVATNEWIDEMAEDSAAERDPNDKQRRQWVRVEGALPVDFEILTGPRRGAKESETVRDISAGGLSFITEGPAPVGTRLRMRLELSGTSVRALVLDGVVVRVSPSPVPLDAGLREFVGIRFESVSAAVRERVNQWVFRRQGELAERKRRLEGHLCLTCGKILRPPFDPDPETCQKCLTVQEADRVVAEYRKRAQSGSNPPLSSVLGSVRTSAPPARVLSTPPQKDSKSNPPGRLVPSKPPRATPTSVPPRKSVQSSPPKQGTLAPSERPKPGSALRTNSTRPSARPSRRPG